MKNLFGWEGAEKIKYLEACDKILNDENYFKNFKRDSEYTTILEHVSPELGYMYLSLLSDDSKKLISQCSQINDTIGNPILIPTEFGMVSPTTIRYLKVIQDLKTIFDMSKIKTIIEIGAGYGGQSRLLLNLFKNIESYTCIDLKEASNLQNKYNKDLSNFRSLSYSNELSSQKADLVISNYAFSELNKETQKTYIDFIINNCNCGYITYNPGAGWELSIPEVISLLNTKKIQLMQDLPMNYFYSENKIIYWN